MHRATVQVQVAKRSTDRMRVMMLVLQLRSPSNRSIFNRKHVLMPEGDAGMFKVTVLKVER